MNFKKLFMILGISCSLLVGIPVANAAVSASYSWRGSSNANVGSTFTVDLLMTGNNAGIVSMGGNYSVADTSCVTIKSARKVDAATATVSKFGFTDYDGFEGASATLVTLTLEAGTSACSTTLNLNGGTVKLTGSGAENEASGLSASHAITVKEAEPAKSNDAKLKSLSPSTGTLSPGFSGTTTSYTLNVGSDVTSVNFTGATNDTKASIISGTTCNLTGNSTTCNIVVKAEDNSTKTYSVVVRKETSGGNQTPTPTPSNKSNNANLKSLSVSGYSIIPGFSADTLEYSLTVPSSANEITVNASLSDSKASLRISGNTNLKTGNNVVTVKVTAEDGTVKNYVINVLKEEDKSNDKTLDGDANLKRLDVSGYTLNPVFKPGTTAYTMYVGSNVDSLKVDAIASSSKSTVEVSGNSGWHEGVNTITIKVTAENGTVKTYTVNVIKKASSNNNNSNGNNTNNSSKSNDASLKSLKINSAYNIDKEFSSSVNSYSVTVPYEVEKLDLSYVPNSSKASVNVSGNGSFKVGEVNTVVVKVTAEDGTENYYIFNVTRNSEKSETSLEKLVVNGYDLVPAFDENITEYTVNVDSDVDKLDISTIAFSKDSKVEVLGNENLKEGHNAVLLKVTDKNGINKYYTLDVIKAASNKSFLGLNSKHWGLLLTLVAGTLLFVLGVTLILFRKKKELAPANTDTPVNIEFKPEFNFSSKNSSDDDVVHGILNQAEEIEYKDTPKKLIEGTVEEAEVYDPYDETVTKTEIIDAIHEAMESKDSSKLKMLLDQDELNQRKKKLKAKEKNNR